MIAVLRFLAVSLVSAFLILFSACVGATRMVTRERGSSGQQIDAKTFDASQVQPGSTTREKVLAQFSMINTGYNDPHLFWGRWAKYVVTLPPIDADEIISLAGEARIALASEWVEAVRTGRKTSTVRVTPDKIVRIAHTGPKDKSNSPGRSCHILYLREKTAVGTKLRFCSEGPALIATLRYLHRYASPNMQWE